MNPPYLLNLVYVRPCTHVPGCARYGTVVYTDPDRTCLRAAARQRSSAAAAGPRAGALPGSACDGCLVPAGCLLAVPRYRTFRFFSRIAHAGHARVPGAGIQDGTIN
eukprot:SAG31_NODE_1620_length_7725_cov_1.520850_4_plen_107_part_00